MPERQVPNAPNELPRTSGAESQEDFDKRLAKGLYRNVDWSEADKDFLRESGLI